MGERGGIEALLDLFEEAFRGRGIEASDESQALLTNLASVPDDAGGHCQQARRARSSRSPCMSGRAR